MRSGNSGLKKRRGLASVVASSRSRAGGSAAKRTTDLHQFAPRSSADVDDAFRQLLEETLPPDKQEALMETYDAETDPQVRYNMLLEFSSYLRQDISRDDPMAPVLESGDLARPGGETSLCWEITRVLMIIAAILVAVVGGATLVMGSDDPMGLFEKVELGDD